MRLLLKPGVLSVSSLRPSNFSVIPNFSTMAVPHRVFPERCHQHHASMSLDQIRNLTKFTTSYHIAFPHARTTDRRVIDIASFVIHHPIHLFNTTLSPSNDLHFTYPTRRRILRT
jgi:hypothetical protein